MNDEEIQAALRESMESNTMVMDMNNHLTTVNKRLSSIIESLQPQAAFARAVMDDGQCYSFATAAKMLSPDLKQRTGHEIGRDRLIDALKAMHIINENREPYQEHVRHFKVVLKQTPVGMMPVSLLTGKGIAWVLTRIVEYYK